MDLSEHFVEDFFHLAILCLWYRIALAFFKEDGVRENVVRRILLRRRIRSCVSGTGLP